MASSTSWPPVLVYWSSKMAASEIETSPNVAVAMVSIRSAARRFDAREEADDVGETVPQGELVAGTAGIGHLAPVRRSSRSAPRRPVNGRPEPVSRTLLADRKLHHHGGHGVREVRALPNVGRDRGQEPPAPFVEHQWPACHRWDRSDDGQPELDTQARRAEGHRAPALAHDP